jgi:hypothetical protein
MKECKLYVDCSTHRRDEKWVEYSRQIKYVNKNDNLVHLGVGGRLIAAWISTIVLGTTEWIRPALAVSNVGISYTRFHKESSGS